ncbi:YgiQ family radical SAM protein [Bacteroidetes/Chlorobi group bacterium ChocPot_Mid]|nr:MAG: YgiQ family radical SAM protein [Bacteroidetes/Chlorobi group bacterium ChocPot_Mid]
MFLPTTKEEMHHLGWEKLDIILISGDVYIDNYYDGSALLGKLLVSKGFKVGIISQPDISSPKDIMRLGEPELFWGVSAGCVDSMVTNYTALLKKKKNDDLTPGGLNNKRPDRAVIKYTNLIRQYFKNTKPIIIGGIEASLRRIAHYDYWSDAIRKSILFDSKADYLVYGMAERTILETADFIKQNKSLKLLRGLCYISNTKVDNYIELPSYDEVKNDKIKFIEMFHHFYQNNDPLNANGLCQKQDSRYLIQNPPNFNLSQKELDEIYELDFERDVHPYYKKHGKVKALETIQFSINSHRGCYGECNFCAITVHQGRTINSRSVNSILKEVRNITQHKDFKGIINDIGGPTANMFDNKCKLQSTKGSCKDKRCLLPERCKAMKIDHSSQIDLLEKVKRIPRVRKVFIGSGLRYDLIIEDHKAGEKYLLNLVKDHVSGQLKIAPEHVSENVLQLMGKPSNKNLIDFRRRFNDFSKKIGKNQFLTYYLIAAHPGCEQQDMEELRNFIHNELKLKPEQMQVFTPTPSTYSTLMYYSGLHPDTLKPIFVEKTLKGKRKQLL